MACLLLTLLGMGVQKGQADGFFVELGTLWPDLVRQGLSLTGNRADAEDLVQSAIERALKRRRSLRPDTRLRAWLGTVIRNLAIDQLRQRWRYCNGPNAIDDLPANAPEPSLWWRDVSDEQVKSALGQCSSPLREAFTLRHYEKLSLAAIAARTGTSVNTVATRIFRARARLRTAIFSQSTDARAAAA
jgi:RNA polymerase sigma-70 factor (ECF subfamily)